MSAHAEPANAGPAGQAGAQRTARFERDALPHLGRLYATARRLTGNPADGYGRQPRLSHHPDPRLVSN